eukprot:442951_1
MTLSHPTPSAAVQKSKYSMQSAIVGVAVGYSMQSAVLGVALNRIVLAMPFDGFVLGRHHQRHRIRLYYPSVSNLCWCFWWYYHYNSHWFCSFLSSKLASTNRKYFVVCYDT